ncbi:YoaK family protein [Stakelama sediminis]|uniref:Uncharacterized membrane protein YoaK (UPF0700 family) n=1 Tax=Stakelama sediminis TaxID=463200 RepID=A0A840YXM0_9SPHN|nr:DUF1275 family protein [Stakelama sediminis]MBB5718403.1 uncharacterized membrane protein YoaK (UPF0700 family) [Stakelama sediminis]
MQRTPAPLLGAALLLAALAGFVDALAYSSLGGFFASFMSGNTTRLGIGLGAHNSHDAFIAGSLILSFITGIILSAIACDAVARHAEAAAMLLVTALLCIAAGFKMFGFDRIAILCLAGAMGAENGVFGRDGTVKIGLTYMTGTLVRFGQRLAAALMGKSTGFAWIKDLLLWLGFLGGVTLGANVYLHTTDTSFWYAALGAAVLTVVIGTMARWGLLER